MLFCMHFNKLPYPIFFKIIILYLYHFWQRLYSNGARKFEIVGVGPIGCCPISRLKNKTECFSQTNLLSIKYNKGLQSMLKEWKLEKKDLISYSYFDSFAALQDIIQNSISYGMIHHHTILYLILLQMENLSLYHLLLFEKKKIKIIKNKYIFSLKFCLICITRVRGEYPHST